MCQTYQAVPQTLQPGVVHNNNKKKKKQNDHYDDNDDDDDEDDDDDNKYFKDVVQLLKSNGSVRPTCQMPFGVSINRNRNTNKN